MDQPSGVDFLFSTTTGPANVEGVVSEIPVTIIVHLICVSLAVYYRFFLLTSTVGWVSLWHNL